MVGLAEDDCPVGIVEYEGRRVAARLAAGIDPSSWILLDADNPPGIPADWAAMSIQQRLEFWEPVMPGISRATRVELRASSARVVKNGESEKEASHALLTRQRCQQDRDDEGARGCGDGDFRAVVPVREEEQRRSKPDRKASRTVVFLTSLSGTGAGSFTVQSPISRRARLPSRRCRRPYRRRHRSTGPVLRQEPDPTVLRDYRLKTGIKLDLKIGTNGSLVDHVEAAR